MGAIFGASPDSVEFLGYGVYDGDFIPNGAGGIGPVCVEIGKTNPRITLDNGKVVWGCECWWGPEEHIKAVLARKKLGGGDVINVDIDEIRKTYARE